VRSHYARLTTNDDQDACVAKDENKDDDNDKREKHNDYNNN